MYTVTPDHYPIMDALQPGGAIVVGCGYSGSGFKHAPASGMMLAALATGNQNQIHAVSTTYLIMTPERSLIGAASSISRAPPIALLRMGPKMIQQ